MIGPTLYEPNIKELIENEIAKLSFGECKVLIYEDPRELDDIDDLTTSRFGITSGGDMVAEFYTSIIEEVFNEQKSFIYKKYSSLEKYIQAIVRHEYRHYCQYKYAKDHGMNMDLFKNQSDILEKDAYDYENGNIHELSEIIKI